MREDAEESVQPLECAWTNVETDVKSLVPAPMREEAHAFVQSLDLAVTTLMLSVANVVPAPRLELGTP